MSLHAYSSRVWWTIKLLLGVMAMNYVLSCCFDCSRTPPTNYLFLFSSVIFFTLATASITAFYQTHIILQAFLATAGVVAICLILACTSFDFTKCILYMIAVGAALMILVAIQLITTFVFHIYSKPLVIVIVILLTIFNVVSLVMELQIVLGGKTIELSVYDYVLGAFMLYTSIISIFWTLLQLMDI